MRTERIEPQRPFFFFFFLTPKCTRLLVADGLVLLSSFYRENILVLDIFFEALNYETIEQKKAYEVAALLGKEVSGVHFGVCVNRVFMGWTDATSGCTGYWHCHEITARSSHLTAHHAFNPLSYFPSDTKLGNVPGTTASLFVNQERLT